MVKTGTLRERLINSTDGIHKPMASETATVSLAAFFWVCDELLFTILKSRETKDFLDCTIVSRTKF
jgi:hypothetical protein